MIDNIREIINDKKDEVKIYVKKISKIISEVNSLSAEEEADRLALAQLFVLTQGQDVPAIYLNDLLGLENDLKHKPPL